MNMVNSLDSLGEAGEIGSMVGRLRQVGFEVLPLPSSTGLDDGLLLYLVRPNQITTVSVWADRYAATLSVPPGWVVTDPFRLPPDARHERGRLPEIVNHVMATLGELPGGHGVRP
jgi:hypothetical protein